MSLKIKIKKLHPDAVIPKYSKPGDAGMDLVATGIQTKNDIITYHTGLQVEIPEGYVGLVCPRSSFNIKGIGTPIGVVDAGYTGSIRVVLEPFNVTWIFKGNRIAQLVILPLPNIKMFSCF